MSNSVAFRCGCNRFRPWSARRFGYDRGKVIGKKSGRKRSKPPRKKDKSRFTSAATRPYFRILRKNFPISRLWPSPCAVINSANDCSLNDTREKFLRVVAQRRVQTSPILSGKALDPIRPALILPEVTDQTKWYLKKHQYSDPESQYVFNYLGSATYGAANYNTKLIDVKEFKSYWDLLNSKWKGKIEARDIREAGPGAGNTRFFYYHPELGPPFIRKLFGEMDVTLFRDFRQGPDWLATGKFAICFFCDVDVLKRQGLPVDTFGPEVFKEGGGLVQQFGTVALVNRAPHPNAAKVFINWLLSREDKSHCKKGHRPARARRIHCGPIFPKMMSLT